MISTRTTMILSAALLVLCASTVVIASSPRNDHSVSYRESEHARVSHDFELPCHETGVHAQHVSHPCVALAVHSTPLSHAPIAHAHKSITARPAKNHLSHEDVARFDMSAYAAHHLGVAVGQEHTYGSTSEWSKGWSYRWMDFIHDGDTVRVCHAMKNHDLHTRYISVWDPSHSRWSEWEQVN